MTAEGFKETTKDSARLLSVHVTDIITTTVITVLVSLVCVCMCVCTCQTQWLTLARQVVCHGAALLTQPCTRINNKEE